MIAYISAYFPPHLGGAEKQAYLLAKALSKKGVNLRVYCSGKGVVEGLDVKRFWSFEVFNTPISLGLFIRLLVDSLKKRVSLIHVHVAHAFFPEAVWAVSKVSKVPYVAHLRGSLPVSSFFGKIFLGFYKKIFLRKFLLDARKVIVLSESFRDFVVRFYGVPFEKIAVVPNGVEVFREKSFKRDFNRILFVGRLSAEKNVDLVIRAMKFLPQDFYLRIVGDGILRDTLKKLSFREGVSDRVEFVGVKKGRDLYEEYQKAGCVVLPSSVEVFSNVLLEAMALGCPIVASDIPGNRDVLQGRAGLFVGLNEGEIARAVLKIREKGVLRKKLVNEARRVVGEYSFDSVAEKIVEVYGNAIR